MSDIICYCGTQCSGNGDCFCDEYKGIIQECNCTEYTDPDMPDYEEDIPYVIND
jgi:hypothetical protein